MNVIICYATCWNCKFDHHQTPPKPHPWYGPDDIEDAAERGIEPPTGNCACSCGRTEEAAA